MARLPQASFTLKLALFALWYPIWMFQTVGYGFLVMWKAFQWLRNRNRAIAETTSCPRGHLVPLYGVYQCACGSIHEGQVWGNCQVCGETCGWTPCTTCSLPICNPEFQR